MREWLLRLLLPRGRNTTKALIETLVAGDSDILSRVHMDAVLERMALHVRHYRMLFFLAMKAILYAVEYGAPLMAGSWRRFSRMSAEERERYLDAWEYNQFLYVRNAFTALKIALLISLLNERALLDFIGYTDSLRRRMERPAEGETLPCPKKAVS